MTTESTKPQDSSLAVKTPEPEPSAENPPKTPDPTAESETVPTEPAAGPQEKRSPSAPPKTLAVMPVHIFVLAATYLIVLIAVFVVYVTWSSFRSHIPASFGQLPIGIVWFGATGAVIASLYGIFVHNESWDSSYNYWHYCRPIFGAVTGSVGALIYLILLNLGSKSAITVDSLTFYVVAFVLGFADKSFIQMLQNVTNVIIKPGNKTSPVNSKGSSDDGSNTPSDG
jgi:uncharacterized integral membrane protein